MTTTSEIAQPAPSCFRDVMPAIVRRPMRDCQTQPASAQLCNQVRCFNLQRKCACAT
jgi:hypothetical protein